MVFDRQKNTLGELPMSATARRMIPIATICLMQSARLLAADDGTAQPELQEIVVTAQKRAEELDKVPISITVFDKAAMDERGILDINGIAAATPGVDYQSLGTVNSISIRGVAPTSGYATTGTYIDDVPVQVRSSAIIGLEGNTEPRVFDLDRVEILRGPQGTLYGAGAMGGLIRFITPQPSLTEDSVYARSGVAITEKGDPTYEIGAAFGGPIVNNEIGFRVSAWHRQDGGWDDDDSAVPGGYVYPKANWQDSDVLRGAMVFAPNDSLRITPSIFYQYAYEHDISEFQPAQSAASQDVFTSYFSVLNPRYSNVSKGVFVNPNLLQEPSNDRFYMPSLKAVYLSRSVQLSLISSYYNRSNDAIQDFSAVTPAIYGLPWQLTAASADSDFIRTTQQVMTDEARLQSANADSRLQWTVGLLFIQSRQQIYNPICPR
jgi:outer membrane receptor protein involved in Fe transport